VREAEDTNTKHKKLMLMRSNSTNRGVEGKEE